MSEEKKPPTTFTELVNGIGPVKVLGPHPYERETFIGDYGQWKVRNNMDVFEVTRDDPEGVVEFWVQWDHIVQRRAPANDGDPWEVIYSGMAQRGTTLRTR